MPAADWSHEGALILTEQACSIGSPRHPLVTGDDPVAASIPRTLTPRYDDPRVSLDREASWFAAARNP